MRTDHEKFMAMAIEEARSGVREGERPFGSVVVRDGEVVGRGRNLSNSTFDPTAHAETRAIRDAATNLKNVILSGCTLYITCEPCFMCCGATLFARIDTLVIGGHRRPARDASRGHPVVQELCRWALRDQRVHRGRACQAGRSEAGDRQWRIV